MEAIHGVKTPRRSPKNVHPVQVSSWKRELQQQAVPPFEQKRGLKELMTPTPVSCRCLMRQQDITHFWLRHLAINASTMFIKRILGIIPVPDKAIWSKFTEGVLEYATDSMQHSTTRSDIIEDINDHQNAVTRFCKNYSPEPVHSPHRCRTTN